MSLKTLGLAPAWVTLDGGSDTNAALLPSPPGTAENWVIYRFPSIFDGYQCLELCLASSGLSAWGLALECGAKLWEGISLRWKCPLAQGQPQILPMDLSLLVRPVWCN